MKKFLFLLLSLAIFSLAEAQWLQQNTPTNSPLRRHCFLDEQFGFAVGVNGTIIKTMDGGINWQLVNSGVTDHLNAVRMTSYQTGYIVGNDGVLLKTIDGGVNWDQINSNINSIIINAHFLNDQVGFYCGQSQIIAKTTDGGLNWSLQDFGSYWLRAIDFPTENIGYCVGDGGHIHKTTDGGENWFFLNSGTTDHFLQVDFPTADTGYVTGINGRIMKTVDGGLIWQTISAGTSDYLSGLSFLSTTTGYVTGFENILYKTTDSGLTWESENLNCADTAVRLLMFDEATGYICGKNGLMLKKCQIPTAEFSYETNELTVEFLNLSSNAGLYHWDFGDGYSSNLMNPSHSYDTAGNYNVCLIANNDCGIDTLCHIVDVGQTGLHESILSEISVYPVPNNGHFKIRSSSSKQISEIIVRDAAGLNISNLNWDTSNNDNNYNLDLSPGIYFLDILLDDTRILKKIIVSH